MIKRFDFKTLLKGLEISFNPNATFEEAAFNDLTNLIALVLIYSPTKDFPSNTNIFKKNTLLKYLS
jgi:hypothetical protein